MLVYTVTYGKEKENLKKMNVPLVHVHNKKLCEKKKKKKKKTQTQTQTCISLSSLCRFR